MQKHLYRNEIVFILAETKEPRHVPLGRKRELANTKVKIESAHQKQAGDNSCM